MLHNVHESRDNAHFTALRVMMRVRLGSAAAIGAG